MFCRGNFWKSHSFGNCYCDVSIVLFLQRKSSEDVLQLEACHFVEKETPSQVFVCEYF